MISDNVVSHIFTFFAALLFFAAMVIFYNRFYTKKESGATKDNSAESLYRDFLHVLENTSDHIYFRDAEHRIRFCSKVAAESVGYNSWHDLIGRHWADILKNEETSRHVAEDRRIMTTGDPILGQVEPYRSRTGVTGWLNTNKIAIRDPLTSEIIGVFGISRDISERKHADDQERIRNKIFEQLCEQVPLPDILALVVDYVETLQKGWACSLLLLETDETPITLVNAASVPSSVGEYVTGAVMQSEKANPFSATSLVCERLVVEDITQSTKIPLGLRQAASEAGFISLWLEPIKGSKGEVLGMVALYSQSLLVPTAATINSIAQVAGIAGNVAVRKRNEATIWRQANYDSLTGLPNRRLFLDRLEQESRKVSRNGLPLALLVVDLDRFKSVNDSFGHGAGDILLTEVARRMQGCLRDSDTVARLGGDEFAVILPNVRNMAQAETIAHNLVEAVEPPIVIGDHVAAVSASVGIALYDGSNLDLDDLLTQADHAMYAIKVVRRERAAA